MFFQIGMFIPWQKGSKSNPKNQKANPGDSNVCLHILVWICRFQVVSRGSFALFVATFTGLRAMV